MSLFGSGTVEADFRSGRALPHSQGARIGGRHLAKLISSPVCSLIHCLPLDEKNGKPLNAQIFPTSNLASGSVENEPSVDSSASVLILVILSAAHI